MELDSKFDAKKIESDVKQYINSIDLEKQIFASDKPEKIRFIEGPPTMNGIPSCRTLERQSHQRLVV